MQRGGGGGRAQTTEEIQATDAPTNQVERGQAQKVCKGWW